MIMITKIISLQMLLLTTCVYVSLFASPSLLCQVFDDMKHRRKRRAKPRQQIEDAEKVQPGLVYSALCR